MAVFRVYLDVSGKFRNEKCDYASLCGYVGHVPEWERFSLEWNNALFRFGVAYESRNVMVKRKTDGSYEISKLWQSREVGVKSQNRSEFEKFDRAIHSILSVRHAEIQKRTKTSPAFHASIAVD
jgi:hypothetical protein